MKEDSLEQTLESRTGSKSRYKKQHPDKFDGVCLGLPDRNISGARLATSSLSTHNATHDGPDAAMICQGKKKKKQR